jgi:uracil-DNA glycosylase
MSIFTGTSGPSSAEIVIVGEAWGAEEARTGQPFMGQSGQELTKILAEAGISRNQCLITNVVSERPPQNEMTAFFYKTVEAKAIGIQAVRGLYPKPNVLTGLSNLYVLLEKVNPKLVIGLGNYPLWALTEDCFGVGNDEGWKVPTGITNWRGSQLQSLTGHNFLPTYHPAGMLRNWPWRYDMRHDIAVRGKKALSGDFGAPNYNFIIQPSFEVVMQTLANLKAFADAGSLDLSVDIETRDYLIDCIGLAWSSLDAICIPFAIRFEPYNYWSEDEEIAIVQELRTLLHHSNVKITGQNFLYDAQYLCMFFGILLKVENDTLFQQHTAWPGKPKDLAYISSLYCQYHRYWKSEGKVWHPTFSDHQHWTYNCKDAVITFEAKNALKTTIEKLHLTEQYALMMEQFPVVLEMMLRGTRIDTAARLRLTRELEAAVADVSHELDQLIPSSLYPRKKKAKPWWGSPIQQMEIFYNLLGYPEVKHPKTKRPTIDDEALEILLAKDQLLRPVIERLQNLRSLRVFKGNFIDQPLDPDFRMRCSFNPAGTVTYRWSSSENAFGNGTNLQNIPVGDEDA